MSTDAGWWASVEDDVAAGSRTRIRVTADEEGVADQAIAALVQDDRVFQRGGRLVDVVRDAAELRGVQRPPDSPKIRLTPLPTLRERLASDAEWIKQRRNENGEVVDVTCHPPAWAVQAVAARGEWPKIRPLESVVETPVLRPDGTVLEAPGYDAATNLLHEPSTAFPAVPSAPSQAQARAAADALLEVVNDFPFKAPAHRSAWLASLLTPLARFAYHGAAPMFLIDANVRGAGKGLLVDVTGIIVSGGHGMAVTTQPGDEDEWRKRITALAVEGARLVLIDNVAGRLGGPTLDAALTATTWSDRILKSSETTGNLPLAITWFATGNNVQLGADTSRRTLHVRLESEHERPEERAGFRHPDLRAWVRQERARLVVAGLTILRAYCHAGRPDLGLRPYGSFEPWSALVRQAVAWTGMPDPCDTREELMKLSDADDTARRALLEGWRALDPMGRGMTTDAVLQRLANATTEEEQALRCAVLELCPPKTGGMPTARQLSARLRGLRGTPIGHEAFDFNTGSGGTARWFVRDVRATSER